FFQAEDGIRYRTVTGVQTCALPIFLLGSAVGALTTSALPAEALHAWGWRLPFLVGLLVGLAGLYIRRQIPEPPAAATPTASPVQIGRASCRERLWVLGHCGA